MTSAPEITSKEVQYVFYIERPTRWRRYLSIVDDLIVMNSVMTDSTRFTLFQDGLKMAKQASRNIGDKIGFVKIVTQYEFREIR